MSINLTLTSPILSLDQKKIQFRTMQDQSMAMVFGYLRDNFSVSFEAVWNNAELTPQEVFDSYGTDSLQLFMIAGATQAMLNAIVPGSSTQVPPYHYTIHQDGTVTVGEKI